MHTDVVRHAIYVGCALLAGACSSNQVGSDATTTAGFGGSAATTGGATMNASTTTMNVSTTTMGGASSTVATSTVNTTGTMLTTTTGSIGAGGSMTMGDTSGNTSSTTATPTTTGTNTTSTTGNATSGAGGGTITDGGATDGSTSTDGAAMSGCDSGPLDAPIQGCAPTPVPDTGDYYADCVARVNQLRWECQCLPPLERWTEGEDCANQDAQYDSEQNSAHAGFTSGICSPGGSAQNECPGWRSTTQVVDGCLQSMWDEGPGEPYSAHGHYINMTNTDYSRVACGFYQTPSGDIWAVMNFSR